MRKYYGITLIMIAGAAMFHAPITSAQDTGAMGFFITSAGPGKGANLDGLAGADQHCQNSAAAVGAGQRVWRAYLSTTATADQSAVNARDRIGKGPWYNAKGVMVAKDVADLHSDANKLNKQNSLNEQGSEINGRGDTPNMHDILTGSLPDGAASPASEDTTCRNWTSDTDGSALLGHHDRDGGGANPTSWNSAHGSRGCSQENLQSTGGNGLFYCFATD